MLASKNYSRFELRVLILFTFLSIINTSISVAQTSNSEKNIDPFNALFKYKYDIKDSLSWHAKKWSMSNLDHKFFVVDSATFHHYQVLNINTNFRKYKEFTMSLKFYIDSSLAIKYQPSLINEQILYSDNGHLKTLTENKDFSKFFGSEFSLKKRREQLFIENPGLVKYAWKTIPEPHRLITDRRHLRKRSAEEGIQALLTKEISKPDKLNEKKKKQGPWTYNGIESVQLSQAYLDNWTRGGENSITLVSDLLLKANYKLNKHEWENFARHKIGVVSSESYATQINTDKIELNSKYGMKASKKWFYSALFNFKSQFFNGYNNKNRETITSGFMSPAYLTLAVGMDFKKDNNFTLLLSPLTAKLTWVMDTAKVDQTRYKIAADRKAIFINGASIVNDINWVISTELSLKSSIDAFVGYLSKDAFTQVDWELIFNMRINKFLSTRINTQLRYFDNESDKIQLKENFTVSFNYKF